MQTSPGSGARSGAGRARALRRLSSGLPLPVVWHDNQSAAHRQAEAAPMISLVRDAMFRRRSSSAGQSRSRERGSGPVKVRGTAQTTFRLVVAAERLPLTGVNTGNSGHDRA
jgi:hypothetical protein